MINNDTINNNNIHNQHQISRKQLDLLLKVDAIGSICFGLCSLLLPHKIVSIFSVEYNHSVHEIVRYDHQVYMRV